MSLRLRDRGDASKRLSVVAGGASLDDAIVVHPRAGAEGFCSIPVARVAGCRRNGEVIRRHSGRESAVMAGNALPRRPLQTAVDVAAHAFDGHVTAHQRKASLRMIEMRSSLLRQCRNGNGNQNCSTNAAEPSKSIHVPPRAMQLRLELEPKRALGNNGRVPAIIRMYECSLRFFWHFATITCGIACRSTGSCAAILLI